MIDGIVRGRWRITDRTRAARLVTDDWTRVTTAERRAVQEAARRYGRFFGIEVGA